MAQHKTQRDQMLELSDREFKIIMINMMKILIQKHFGSVWKFLSMLNILLSCDPLVAFDNNMKSII